MSEVRVTDNDSDVRSTYRAPTALAAGIATTLAAIGGWVADADPAAAHAVACYARVPAIPVLRSDQRIQTQAHITCSPSAPDFQTNDVGMCVRPYGEEWVQACPNATYAYLYTVYPASQYNGTDFWLVDNVPCSGPTAGQRAWAGMVDASGFHHNYSEQRRQGPTTSFSCHVVK